MSQTKTRRAPGGDRSPEFPAANTAVLSRADGRGGQRHLPVAPPRSLSSTPFYTPVWRTAAGTVLLRLRARLEAW